MVALAIVVVVDVVVALAVGVVVAVVYCSRRESNLQYPRFELQGS